MTDFSGNDDIPPNSLVQPYEGDQGAYRFGSDPTTGTIALKHTVFNTVAWMAVLGFLTVAWVFVLLLKHLSTTHPNPPPGWLVIVFQGFLIFATVMTLVIGPTLGALMNRKKKPRLLFDGKHLSYPSLPGWNDVDLSDATGVAFIRGGYKAAEGQHHEYGSIYQIAVRIRGMDESLWWSVAGFSFNRRAVYRFAQELASILRVSFHEARATERIAFTEVVWTRRRFAPTCKQTPLVNSLQTQGTNDSSGG